MDLILSTSLVANQIGLKPKSGYLFRSALSLTIDFIRFVTSSVCTQNHAKNYFHEPKYYYTVVSQVLSNVTMILLKILSQSFMFMNDPYPRFFGVALV